jgi:hypothetical protein
VSDSDPFDDPSYWRFVREQRKHCRCCTQCGTSPCDGVLAGGMCDQWCHCDREDYDQETP